MRVATVLAVLLLSGSLQAAGTTRIEIKAPAEQAIPGNNNEVFVVFEVVMELSSDEKGFNGVSPRAWHVYKTTIPRANSEITPITIVVLNEPVKGQGPTTSKFKFKAGKGWDTKFEVEMEYETATAVQTKSHFLEYKTKN